MGACALATGDPLEALSHPEGKAFFLLETGERHTGEEVGWAARSTGAGSVGNHHVKQKMTKHRVLNPEKGGHREGHSRICSAEPGGVGVKPEEAAR